MRECSLIPFIDLTLWQNGYEYYCEELFVVKRITRYSCSSTSYINLELDVIKSNCEFQYYYNKTDIKPTILDGGFQIILANLANYRKIMCSHNNNIPINIPGHPYILMNWSILCNCDIEAESNFLLESLAAWEGSETKTDLEMHFTINLAFVNYFDDMIEELGIPVSWNWMTQEQILPLSLETFEINPNLINAPKTLQDLAIQYRNKKNILDKKEQKLDKPEENSKFRSFLNSFLANILTFTAAQPIATHVLKAALSLPEPIIQPQVNVWPQQQIPILLPQHQPVDPTCIIQAIGPNIQHRPSPPYHDPYTRPPPIPPDVTYPVDSQKDLLDNAIDRNVDIEENSPSRKV